MNSPVCVDASFIIRTLVLDRDSDKAIALLDEWQQQETRLIGPALLAFEVTASLRRLVYLKAITSAQGEEAFRDFLRIPLHLSSRRGIYPLAWQLAKDLNRPRAYDTAYLALAKLVDCEFWTADERLYNAVKDQLVWVRWIGNFQTGSGRQ